MSNSIANIGNLTSDGAGSGLLTISSGDAANFQVGATDYLVAAGKPIEKDKINSKPTSTTVQVTKLNDTAFNAACVRRPAPCEII